MWIGAIELDLLLGDIHSLKEKRSVVRPIIAEVRRKFDLSVAEVDHLDLHRRTAIGVAVVSPDAKHVTEVLDEVERLISFRPGVDLVSARRSMFTSDDE